MNNSNKLENIKILYVEDEELLRNSTLEGLKYYFNDITTAKDGEEGLRLFKENEFDVIVSDIHMPVLNGVEMLRTIRIYDPKIPFIFVSAHSDVEYFIDSIDLGVNKYITKPIKIQSLIDAIVDTVQVKLQQEEINEKDEIILEQAQMSAIGETIHMISHQWRQPLTTISTLIFKTLYKAENELLTDEMVKSELNRINDIVSKLSHTIDSLQSVYRSSHDGKDCLIPRKAIDECVSLFSSLFEENNIVCINNIQNDNSIKIQHEKFVQVITNLITNSIEAFENHLSKEKKIIINEKISNGKYIIIFEDNAGGIDENIADSIFKPYTSTKGFNYRGLGLYVCKIVLMKLHGNLSYEPIDGGSKFIIEIPTC